MFKSNFFFFQKRNINISLPSQEVDIKFRIPNILYMFSVFILTISLFLEFEHTKFGCILYVVEIVSKYVVV